MDEDYPLYLRYRLRGDSIPTDSCPGKNCNGSLTEDSSLLGATTWECDTCGATYDVGESDKDGMARADTDTIDGRTDSWTEYRDGNYVEIK